MDEKLELLRSVPLFADLDERSLQAISLLAREVDAPAGEILMLEGEPGDAFYVIVEGTVRVQKGERPIRSMTAGGFLGEVALIDRRPRTATATCTTDCRLLVVERHEFDRLLDTFPAIERRVRATIMRRLRGPEPHLLG